MYDLLIKNGNVVIGNSFENLNIGIKNNKISLLSTSSNYESDNIVDAKNLIILPGVIDSQVHFREPGSEYKEDLQTGSMGAALGGVTSVFEMPNTYPPTSTVERLKDKFELAKDRMWVNYAFYAGATKENFSSLPELEKVPGCVGVKIFMGSSTGNLLVPDDETLINVFIPTTPNPTSGFLLFVPKKDLIYMKMKVEDAVKMVISGGIVTPKMKTNKIK